MSKRKPRATAKRVAPSGMGSVPAAAATATIASRADPPTSAISHWLIPVLLIVAGFSIYANGLVGTFLLDDNLRIVNSPQIRHPWPPWIAMADSTRPVLELTLAFNYALGRLNPVGYHAFNIAVHLLAGLTLFGIVRRMLSSSDLRARYGEVSSWLAASVAALWLVHPLQTGSVTYIVQRAESLMGLFYLLTLYCSTRSFDPTQPLRWRVAAVAACALGMGCKEVMVSAPILVLLYDRTFAARSFADALHERWPLYAWLAATWLVLAASLANGPVDEQQVRLMGVVTPWSYALTQFEVIVHYLRLSLWPQGLTFDYAWPVAQGATQVLPSAILIIALLAGTVVALCMRTWIGFWGAWFFVILAPTSSIMPIGDIAFEHRMYLPLAAVVVVVVVGGYDLVTWMGRKVGVSSMTLEWLEGSVAIAVLATLGYLTIVRNVDYWSELAMWSDTVAKRPGNARAHVNLGLALKRHGDFAQAATQYNEALRIKPDYAEAHNDLGNALALQGRLDEAIAHYGEALRINPRYSEAHLNWGMALYNQDDLEGAVVHYGEALRLDPNHPGAHNNMGIALAHQGMLNEAATHFAAAVHLDPAFAWARENLRKVEAARAPPKDVP